MEKKTKKQIISILSIVTITSVVVSAIYVASTVYTFPRFSFSKTYTLRGLLYDADDLGNNSYCFHMNETSFRPWGCEDCWSFPYQQGKKDFYFSNVSNHNISDFIDRDIDITYVSDGVYSEISEIGFTFYDSIREAEKKKEKQLDFDEWMQENHPEILIEYSEYLQEGKKC